MYRGQLNEKCLSTLTELSRGLLIITTGRPSTPYTPVDPCRNTFSDGRSLLSPGAADEHLVRRHRSQAKAHRNRTRNEHLQRSKRAREDKKGISYSERIVGEKHTRPSSYNTAYANDACPQLHRPPESA